MKRLFTLLMIGTVMPLAASASFLADDDVQPSCASGAGSSFEAVFSPPRSLSQAVINEIGAAKRTVRLSSRIFVSKPLSETLIKVAHDGVDVKVVLEKKANDTMSSESQFLLNMSHPARLTKTEDTLHSSYIVIDGKDVVLGNIAELADIEEEKKSQGNVLIIHNAPDLARQYMTQWQELWDSSIEMKDDKK